MVDRPRDNEPPDLPPEGGDRPEKRPERPDRPYELSKEFQPDRRKLTPIQREFARSMADGLPERTGEVPYSLDFTTGESVDHEKPPPDLGEGIPEDVSGVHDPIDATRPYDRWGGLAHPDQRDQWSLEHVVPRDADGNPERYPSLDGEWTAYVNDGGPEADPLRGNNCLDCSMAAIATYHGEPTVAAPRTLGYTRDYQNVDISDGEQDGPLRAQEWLGGEYRSLGLGDGGYSTIEEKLREAGPGSSAAIINSWKQELGGGSHAWNAFNDGGKIVWYDPQRGQTSDEPVHRGSKVEAVWAICIDPEGKQL